MLSAELKSQLTSLWQKFWANGMSNHITAIQQMSYLIFIKKLEDYDNERILATKTSNVPHRSIFTGKESLRWSYWKNLPGEKMLQHVHDVVFPFIKNLGQNKDSDFRMQMRNANFEIQSPVLLYEAVQVIDSLQISLKDQDVQGDIFEELLSELATAGLNGQFRTPGHIIRMMVQMVDPDVGQEICDPACGTGGFLANVYRYIMAKYTSKDVLEYDDDGIPHHWSGNMLSDKQRKDLQKQLHGFDFENSMISISCLNLIMLGINKPNIEFASTLSKNFEQEPAYDLIFANPPFSGNLEKSDINENFQIQTTKTELLFLELFYNLLVIGGQACVIVPEGALFGSSNAHKKVRQILLEECRLDAVISLPSGVFKPYAGVATSILFFTKGEKTKKVWFYQMENDGYSLDDKRLKIDKNDIPDILEKFKHRTISDKSWLVDFDTIKQNEWNLTTLRYKQYVSEEIEYDEPVSIINEIEKLEKEISRDFIDLKKLLMNET